MSYPATSFFPTGGKTDTGWYSGRFAKVIRERVAVAGNAQSATLTQPLPAGCRIVWAAIKNNSAITPGPGAATNVAQIGVALVWTAPTSLATGSTTSNVALGSVQTAFAGSIAANSLGHGLAGVTATAGGVVQPVQNTATSNQTLYLIPFASTVATAGDVKRFSVNTTAATSGFQFNGTSTTTIYFDVEVFVETFDPPPDR